VFFRSHAGINMVRVMGSVWYCITVGNGFPAQLPIFALIQRILCMRRPTASRCLCCG